MHVESFTESLTEATFLEKRWMRLKGKGEVVNLDVQG